MFSLNESNTAKFRADSEGEGGAGWRGRGQGGGDGGGGSFEPHFDSNFHFHEKFWDTVFTLKIHTSYSLPYTSLQQFNLTTYECV